VLGDEVHRIENELKDGLGDEVVEVDSHPAWLDALAPAADLPLELTRCLDIDTEESVPVGTGA